MTHTLLYIYEVFYNIRQSVHWLGRVLCVHVAPDFSGGVLSYLCLYNMKTYAIFGDLSPLTLKVVGLGVCIVILSDLYSMVLTETHI